MAGTLLATALTAPPAHGAAAAVRTSSSTTATTEPSTEQALAKAQSTGQAVQVPGATTTTSTLTANPDGTLTLTQSPIPVRTRAAGAWVSLDATLRTNNDGSISTTATTGTLTLSPGGSGPLAVMNAAGKTLALTLPVTLPAPTLSGASATYPSVLPGIDLKVTADSQGGFSEVLIVNTPAAAANPALATLTLAARTGGVALTADAAGNITARDPGGHTVFAASAPTMWDSAAAPASIAAVTNPATGQALDPTSGLPLASSPQGPGEAAHIASLNAAATAATITLTPNQALLTAPTTVYPVYLDPTFTAPSAGSTQNSWTMVNSYYPTTSYWKSGTGGLMQVGYDGWDSPTFTARGFVNIAVPSALYNSTIISSQINFTEEWSPSCSTRNVDLWTTGAISSSTTWNAQPAWNSKIGTANVAHGYNSSCPAAGVGYDITSTMQADANNKATNQTFGLQAASETDAYGWKQFASATTVSTTYDHTPNTPAGMTTSPNTQCTATPPTPVGDGQVTLYAPVSDPDGGTLGVHFQLWKTGTPATILASSDPNTLTNTSGTTAVLNIPETTLKTAAGSTLTEFSWNTQTTDFNPNTAVGTSSWSTTCNFNFDPTRQGAPVITPPPSSGGMTGTIGTTETFTIAKPTTGTTPGSYLYQLNGAAPLKAPADTNGNATLATSPTRFTNTLTVTSVSAGGNIGDTAALTFNSNPANTQTDGDLTGDNIPDLLTTGNQNGLPPGLWLAQGNTSGQVATAATDLGTNGTGVGTSSGPTDYNGTQAITGHFNTGGNLQDVLVYNPSTGTGTFLFGNGDGSPLQPLSGSAIVLNNLTALTDANGNIPQQLANAGNTSGLAAPYPDLIGISNNTLSLYASGTPGQYANADQYGTPIAATLSPDTTLDWNTWTIVTAQDTRAGTTTTDMYVWNKTTGALYLWENLAYNTTTGANNLTYTPFTIANGTTTVWNKGANLTLEAADVNQDGTPDLYTTGANGITTTYLATAATTTATLAAQPNQTLVTGTHTWPLNDNTTGQATTTADTTGATHGSALNLTGTTGATWNTGDLFTPDVKLDGTTGHLAATTGALDLTNSFTVSAWVKPATGAGVVLSQDGTADSGFVLYPTSTGWTFGLNTGAGTAWNFDGISGGTVQYGSWTHLTATYDKTTTVMGLYVDDVFVATGNHTAPATGATGPFQIGDDLNASTRGAYFNGQVAGAQTWNQALPPTPAPGTASYHQAITPTHILDTRNTTGDTLTDGTTTASTPVAANSTTTLRISGDTIAPTATGAPTTIPTTVTAVSLDLTVTSPTANGFITTYADSTQRPTTSSTNYANGYTTTDYQIVPVGLDGKIALYNGSTGTTNLLVDITGYFTSDPTLTGDQTYTPLTTAYRALDTATSTNNTNLTTTGTVAAGKTFTLNITGVDNIPTTATAVALNLTTFNETCGGLLIAYPTGTPQPSTTTLTYANAQQMASMSADIPLGTGGTITIANLSSCSGATDIIGDISGYYTTNTTGQKYHAVNPTRLVDTNTGIGGTTGPIPAQGTYTLTQTTTQHITTATTPTLVTMLTVVNTAAAGDLIAYPGGATPPTTSNINWYAGQITANLALTPTSTTGTISILNQSTGTTNLIIDSSGYYSAN